MTHLGTVAISSLTNADLEAELAARPVPAFAFNGAAGAGSRKQQLQQALADAVRGADNADAGGDVGAVRVKRLVDEDDGAVATPLGATMRRPDDAALPPTSEPISALFVRLGLRGACRAER